MSDSLIKTTLTLHLQPVIDTAPLRRPASAERRPFVVWKLPHIASAQEIPAASTITFHAAGHAHPPATLRLPRRHTQLRRAANHGHAPSSPSSPTRTSAAGATAATASGWFTSQRPQFKRFASGTWCRFRRLPANCVRFRPPFQFQVTPSAPD